MQSVLISIGVVVAIVVGGVAVVAWFGHRMVRDAGQDGSASGVGNAFGGFDVFDPSRARAKEDLESQKHQATVTPSPDGDDRPVRFDIDKGVARIRRTPPAASSEAPAGPVERPTQDPPSS